MKNKNVTVAKSRSHRDARNAWLKFNRLNKKPLLAQRLPTIGSAASKESTPGNRGKGSKEMLLKHKFKALLGACLAVAALAAVSAAPASAGFGLAACAGTSPIEGRGATFQTDAHTAWNEIYNAEICAGDEVKYNAAGATGSGAGRSAFMNREFNVASFAGTDEAPTIGATGNAGNNATVFGIEEGPAVLGDHEARLLVIPATSAAIAIIVNTPANCQVVDTVGEGPRPNRATVSKQEIEEVFAAGLGKENTWSELGAFSDTDADCKKPIKRIVRKDSSGTTSQFKLWLETVDDHFGDTTNWDTLAFGAENTKWPVEGTVNRPANNGGPEVAKTVEDNAKHDGSIGYVVLADANPNFGGGEAEGGIYWLALRTGSPTSTTHKYEDPLAGTKSNCANVTYKKSNGEAAPATVWGRTADWSTVTGFNTTEGAYSICSLTYILAWYDGADVTGSGGLITEGRQRAVHDYVDYITSAEGQEVPEYYSPLPEGIRKTAEKGADTICWNMAGEKEVCTP
jgi:ABC-type phosphate transport system substrate-binding protein